MTEAAANRHHSALLWKNLWTTLLFVLGIAVVGFLTTSLILLVRGAYLESAASGFATLLSGGGFAWILERWRDAKKDEQDAFRDLEARQRAIKAAKQADSSRTPMVGRLNQQ